MLASNRQHFFLIDPLPKTMSRTIAIGDIHGCSVALDTLLNAIQPQRRDTLIGLGDFVDRGPKSNEVIERLVELITVCRFVPLIGNHELMMFAGLRNKRDHEFWMQHGGSSTLASYGGNAASIPQHHITFLGHCLRFFETEHHFFVHANYLPYLPLEQQPDDCIFWQHIYEEIPAPHMNGKTAVVGHTPQSDGMVRNYGNVILLDTYCYGNQWLTALDVDTGKLWQANQMGQLRELELPATED
jgi:serine/threonine protein phosphatase 1